MYVRRVSRSKH